MPEITGVVMERYSNKPLAGASVSVGGSSTSTDMAGRFSMFVAETGNIPLSVSFGGYDDYSVMLSGVMVNRYVTVYLSPRFGFMQ